MNNTWMIWGLGAAAAGLAALTLLLYWFVICAVLYWHGARFPTGLMPWRYFRDLRDYKEIIAAKGKTSTLYYFMLFLTWATILLLVTLAVAVWDHRQTTGSLRRRLW
jgi:hypothetical protein